MGPNDCAQSDEGERAPLLNNEAPSKADTGDAQLLSTKKTYTIICAVWLGVFLGALDTTIVATLLSSISSSFAASNQISWLGTSYLMSTASVTPLYGRLCDIIGRRSANLLALSLFFIGTLLCGIASSMNMLIAARLIAGMGGGGMMSTSSIIASDLIPLRERGMVQGLTNICFGLGAGLGGPLGGLMSDHIGWRFAFLIQLPFLLISMILVSTLVKYKVPSQSTKKGEMLRRVDWLGAASLVILIMGLLFGLGSKENEQLPWSHPLVWVPLIIFATFCAIFGLVEAKISPEPIIPMKLLRRRSPFFILLVNFLGSSVTFSILYYYPLWFQVVRLENSTSAGLHLVPNAFALAFGSVFAGLVMRMTGRYYWLALVSAAMPISATFIMTTLQEDSPRFIEWIAIVPAGFGFGSLITSMLIALISAVERTEMATATGASYLFRYTGQVTGVAVSGALLQAVLAWQLERRITGDGAAEVIEKIRHTASLIHTLDPELKAKAIASWKVALHAVYAFNGGITALTALCCVPIQERHLASSFSEGQSQRRERQEERNRDSA